MAWQDQLLGSLPSGTRETSGYRTPAQERALGGPASSYHSRGTPDAPGAIDIGGPADKLKQLFDEIRRAFAGRINELYLNLPSGQSEAIKNNQPLDRNPEEGRAQHLHVALEPSVAPTGGDWRTPYAGKPQWIEGGPDAGGEHKACLPRVPHVLDPPPCLYWSDVWFYGIGLGLVLGGSLLVFRGAGK